jgi:hypothetical protein
MEVFIPTLGSVSPVQEAEIVLCDLFDEFNNFSWFELGCVQNPLTGNSGLHCSS